jgi:ribonuclease HI
MTMQNIAAQMMTAAITAQVPGEMTQQPPKQAGEYIGRTETAIRPSQMTAARIYTDGACNGNPGPGGWAYILNQDGVRTETSGAEPLRTTNNRMEMQAAIEALSALTEPSEVQVTTDSQYLAIGIIEWLPGWKESHWQTAGRKPVANRDLWEALDLLCQRHKVSWEWVRGHSGDADNERCDFLANQQAGIPAGFEPAWKRQKEKKANGRQKAKDDRLEHRRAALRKVAGLEDEIRARRADGVSWGHLIEQYGVPESLIRSIARNRDLNAWLLDP